MNLFEKLLEIGKEVDYLQKTAKGLNYKYVPGSDILYKIKGKMNDLKIMLYPVIQEIKTREFVEKRYEKDTNIYKKDVLRRIVEGRMLYVWVNCENPEDKLEVPFGLFGEQDDISKAFGSGLTYSERYFILKFFNIATDNDDPDAFLERQQNNNPQDNETKPKEVKQVKHDFLAKPLPGFKTEFESRIRGQEQMINKYFVYLKQINEGQTYKAVPIQTKVKIEKNIDKFMDSFTQWVQERDLKSIKKLTGEEQ